MSIPLIGQTKTEPVEEKVTLTDEQKEHLAKMAEEHPEDIDDAENVTTAFFIVIHTDGSVDVNTDVTARYAPDRRASADDVTAGTAVASQALLAARTSEATVMGMMQMTQAMAQRQQQQQMMQGLQKQGNLRG